jgi:hypothetical protein
MRSVKETAVPTKTFFNHFTALTLLALLGACGGGGSNDAAPTPAPIGSATPTPTPAPTPSPPASVEREVLPASTDPAITTDLQPHFAINPNAGATARQRLLVFLPGTFGSPSNYRTILREAAAQGLHAIGLNYPNNATVASLCANSTDANCNGDTRLEILTGTDTSSVANISRANSIENRLIKLLQALHTQAPQEGWDAYLTAGTPEWSRIRIAGHSQGGGHAAFIAKRYLVDRAVYFGAPADTVANTAQLAPWLLAAGATPSARQAGFTHERDELARLPIVSAAWQALGLTGPLNSVDTASPPYGGSRQLTTNAPPAPGATALSPLHSTPIVDGVTPINSAGSPVFASVWRYLCID